MESLRSHRTSILCAIFTALYIAGTTLADAPLLRLWELSLCRSYYLKHDSAVVSSVGYVEEQLCKVEDIQEPLAILRGFDGFFWASIGLLIVPLYSYISPRYNRQKIILLGLVGYLLSQIYVAIICYFYRQFPIRLVWLASLSTLVGGGPMITISLVQAIVADQIDPALLNSYFNYTRAANLVIDVLTYSAAAYLMTHNVWLRLPVGISIYLLCLPLLLIINDKSKTSYTVLVDEDDGRESDHDIVLDSVPVSTTDDAKEAHLQAEVGSSPTAIDPQLQHNSGPEESRNLFIFSCTAFWNLVARDGVIRLTLIVFFLDAFAINILDITSQWASKNLGWTIAQTEYVRSYQSAVGGVVLLLLPTASKLMQRRGATGSSTSYLVAKYSLYAFAIGSLGFGISWARATFIVLTTIFSLGSSFHDAVKSYTSTLAQPHQITQLYIGVSATARLGNLIGGPFWSECIVVSMSGGRFLSGLPFLVSVPVWLAGYVALTRLRHNYGRDGNGDV